VLNTKSLCILLGTLFLTPFSTLYLISIRIFILIHLSLLFGFLVYKRIIFIFGFLPRICFILSLLLVISLDNNLFFCIHPLFPRPKGTLSLATIPFHITFLLSSYLLNFLFICLTVRLAKNITVSKIILNALILKRCE